MNLIYIFSPLDQFEVTSLIGFSAQILGLFNICLTNISFYILLILLIIVGLHIYADNNYNLILNKWSTSLEASFASLNTMVREQIGSLNEIYFPFIYSIFFYILIGNLISNVPYSFAVNASAIATLGLSITIFIGVTILSLFLHNIKFFSYFIPNGTPLALIPLLVLIEIVSYLARGVSLGVRLFANIFAGHSLLKILSTFLYKLFSSSIFVAFLTLIPFSIFLGIIGLEFMVSFIQSFVLTLLVCSYLKDAIELH
jgi:F-type H+-transporting ATPase subunit a